MMLRKISFDKTLLGTVLLSLLLIVGCESSLSPEEGLQRAEKYRNKGDYNAAIIELKNVLRTSPQHRDTRLMLSELYISQRDGDSAEAQLQKVRELSQDSYDIRLPLGRALLLQEAYDRVIEEVTAEENDTNLVSSELLTLRAYAHFFNDDFEQAEQLFREAQAANKDNASTRVGQAIIRLEKGDYKESGQLIEQALGIDAGNRDAWLVKGRLALIQMQHDLAEEAFRQAVSVLEGFTFLQPMQAYAYLVQALMDQGKMDAAGQVVTDLAKTHARHPMLQYLRAHIAYESGDYESASEHIKIIRSIAPDYDPALILEGAINYALGSHEQSNIALSAYLTRHPDSSIARKLLAATRLKLKQPEQAYDLVSPLLQQDPNNMELLLLAGSAMSNAGKPEASIPMIEQALQQEPDNINLKIQLAAARLANEETDEAIRILLAIPPTADKFGKRELMLLLAWSRKQDYEAALAFVDDYLVIHPEDPGVLRHSGVILMHMDKTDDARVQFEKALSLKPDNKLMLMTLAQLEFKQKNYARVEELLGRLLVIQPDDASVLYAMANISAQKGDKANTIHWLERARLASKTALKPRLLLVKLYIEQENITKAREAGLEATLIAPQRADVWTTYGAVQNRAGDPEGAINSLLRAEELEPESENILMDLARLQLSVKNLADASRTLRKLRELSPDNIQVASMLALAELKQGNKQQAFEIARQQQSIEKNRSTAMTLEGDLYMLAGEPDKAIDSYQAAEAISPSEVLTVKLYSALKRAAQPEPERVLQVWLKTNPDHIAIRLLLASQYLTDGKAGAAIAEYKAVLARKPDDPDVLNNLALAYHMNKDPEAVQTAEKAYQLNTDSPAIKDTLGWMLVQENEAKRGLPLLREALKQLPDNVEIQYHYAVALAETGDRTEARKRLQQVVDSELDFPARQEAKHYLQALKL